MNPSQLDESLLTAYLDNELTEKDRILVEEQLKANEHWKQLLKELQSVQSLIRDLPKPMLARSLTDGPWTKHTQPNAALGTRETKVDIANHRSFPKSVLALAAGLILCAVGSFAWMRFGTEQDQIARLEQKANPEASPASSTVVDMEAAQSLPIDAPAAAGLKDVEKTVEPLSRFNRESSQRSAASESDFQLLDRQVLEPGEPKLQSSPPMPAAKAEMSDSVGFAFGGGVLPSIALNPTPSYVSTEPVETLIAVRSRSFGNTVLGEKVDEGLAKDKKEANAKKDDHVAPRASETRNMYFQEPQAKRLESLDLLELAPNQRYELRVLRSDLPATAQRLRELGWEFQVDGVPTENEMIAARSMRRLDEASSDQDNVAAPRPPMLTGAIVEPTDWIRILFEGGRN